MKLKDYYLHGTAGIYGKYYKLHTILLVLKDQELRTRKSMGDDAPNPFFNNDEICLCDPRIKLNYFNKDKFFSAYKVFIERAPSLVLRRDLEVFRPEIITKKDKEYIGSSNMYDEVRHKGNIPMSYLEAITYPISTEEDTDKLDTFGDQILYIENRYPNIPLIDLSTGEPIDLETVKKRKEKVYQKKYYS